MLEGTDLFQAYQPLNSYGSYSEDAGEPTSSQQQPRQVQQAPAGPAKEPQKAKEPIPQQQAPLVQQQNPDDVRGMMYDAGSFNKQYEQEQRILQAINSMQNKPKVEQVVTSQQPSYFDKLFSKKKDLGRLFQFSLIIVLGLSIHCLIKHYMKTYLSEHDLTFERQLFLRLLYPLSVLFVLWNFKVFVR